MTPLQLPIKSVKKGQCDYHMVSCSSDGGGGVGKKLALDLVRFRALGSTLYLDFDNAIFVTMQIP